MELSTKRINESSSEKTNNLGLRPGPTKTGLYKRRRWLDAGNLGFRKVEELY